MKRILIAFLTLLILVSPDSLAQAADEADPQKVFNDVYGSDVRRVQATSDTADDLALATEIFESSKLFSQKPQLFAVICRKVIELASVDVLGLATVKKCLATMRQNEMTIVATDFPAELVKRSQSAYIRAKSSQRAEAGDAFINVVLEYGQFLESIGNSGLAITQYRRASSIAIAIRWPDRARLMERMNAATARRVIEAQIQSLKKQLKVNPADTSAGEELIYLYLIELDDSVGARKAASTMTNTETRNILTWATSDVENLDEQAASNLAIWYEKILPKAKGDEARTRVLTRTLAALNLYLKVHKNQDLDRLRFKVKRDRFAADLAKIAKADLQKPRILPAELKRGLVVHLRFDKNDKGSVRDTSSAKNHGKATGATWSGDGRGKDNGAIELDGKGGQILLPPTTIGPWNALTYCIWVKAPPYTGSSWPSFIGSHTSGPGTNQTIGFWQGTGTLRLEIDTSVGNFAFQGKHILPANKWFHVAMVYDGKTVTEYVNGVTGASFPASGTLNKTASHSLGLDHPMYESFLGHLDDAMIYNRALTAKQIKQLYDLQRSRSSLNKLGKPMVEHMDRITPHLLMDHFENDQGKEGINGWRKNANGNDGLPVVLVNASDKDLNIPGTALAGSVMTHPPSAGGAGIAWKSPLTGTFRIKGSVADAHAGGNSVSWKLQALHAKGHTTLASGSVEPQGVSQFVTETSTKALVKVQLKAGEMIQLVVLPKGDYSSDSSRVDWSITEVDGRGRVWNLAKDIVPDLHEEGKGNPHSDSHGNKDVWYFYEVPPDKLLD